jgi:hypothetical protein
MVCNLALIAPEIWMTLPLEAKRWLLNERKLQQQGDDKTKKSLALSKSTAVPNEKDTNNSNLPNQYARVKNVAKGEDVIKGIKYHISILDAGADTLTLGKGCEVLSVHNTRRSNVVGF